MMRRVFTVARHEVRGYFDQATAYVLAVAFLSITLFLAFRSIYASGVASLRPIFDLLPVLFAVFVPAATMRTLAEERRSKTLEWLLAQPLTEAEVVLGKFLGDWAFVLLALLGTLPTALGILLVSEADPGIVAAQYIGAALLAAQFVALGVWASSVTRNQITAFIVGATAAFALFLIGLPVVQIGLPPVLSGALARLSVLSHFENVARGVVDLRDVLYFASTTALFLILTLTSLGSQRLSHARPEFRRLRTGAAVVVVLVVMVNLLGSHVRGRLDLTRDDLFTLSEGAEEILGELDDLVQIKLFASKNLPPEVQLQLRDVRDLLADMRAASNGNLVVTELNPDDDEDAADEARELGIYPVEFNVLRDDEFEVRQGYWGLAVVYADEREVIPVIQRTDNLEFRLTSQIYRMTADEKPTVAFVTGFGAKGPFAITGLTDALADRYDLVSLNLQADSTRAPSPDSVRVLVVAGPTQSMDTAVVERIRAYTDAGGAALFLIEPVTVNPQSPLSVPVASGIEQIVEARGVQVDGDMVVDLASSERINLGRQGFFSVIAPYPYWPVVLPAGDHPITNGLNSLTLSWGTSLTLDDAPSVTPLWQTTPNAASRPASSPIMPDQEWGSLVDSLSTKVVAAAVLPADSAGGGRMVVVGDASFVDGQFLQANPGNLLFVANAIDWLAQDEALIRIRSKDRTPPTLVFSSDATKNLLKWGNLVGMPVLFALVGLLRVTGRRRREEARWKEVVS